MNVLFFRGFQAPSITNHHQLLGKIRTEHIEGEARADPIIVIDADKGVVIDIRWHSIAFKIKKVHPLTTGRVHSAGTGLGKQIDQVKVVTTFLDKSTAAEALELIPLIDLV